MSPGNPYGDEPKNLHSIGWWNWKHLTVMAVCIVILVVLLLPAVFQARINHLRTHSANNLKQIILAVHNFHDTRRRLPNGVVYSENQEPLFGWQVQILPYIESSNLYSIIEPFEPWDHPFNEHVFKNQHPVFTNPKIKYVQMDNGYYLCHYSMNRNIVHRGEGIRLGQLKNGLSNVWLGSEIYDNWQCWGSPYVWHELQSPAPKYRDTTSYDSDGFNLCMADGSIEFFDRETDPGFIQTIRENSPDVEEKLWQKPANTFDYLDDTNGWKHESVVITQEEDRLTTAQVCQSPNGQTTSIYIRSDQGKQNLAVTSKEVLELLESHPFTLSFRTNGTLTDEIVEGLPADQLRFLRAGQIKLTSRGYEMIGRFQALEELVFQNHRLGTTENLQKALPNCKIIRAPYSFDSTD